MTNTNLESSLIARAKEGDEMAFGHLVRPRIDELHAYLARMTGRYDDGRDLVQETLIRAWRGIGGYRDRGRFGPWLFTIARRVAIDEARTRKQTVSLTAGPALVHLGPDPLDKAEAADFLTDLDRALGDLSEERRSVFLLRQHAGLTFREIAEQMKIPLGTALSHMHHAIRDLREVLQHHDH